MIVTTMSRMPASSWKVILLATLVLQIALYGSFVTSAEAAKPIELSSHAPTRLDRSISRKPSHRGGAWMMGMKAAPRASAALSKA